MPYSPESLPLIGKPSRKRSYVLHSFIHSFIHSLIHSFIYSFIHSFIVSLIQVLDHNKYCGSGSSKHLLCEERLDVNSFLSKASEHDFDQFCLAYTLTWRDFSGGTLGLAWVGYPGLPKLRACLPILCLFV